MSHGDITWAGDAHPQLQPGREDLKSRRTDLPGFAATPEVA